MTSSETSKAPAEAGGRASGNGAASKGGAAKGAAVERSVTPSPKAEPLKKGGVKTLAKVAAAGDLEAKRTASMILEVMAGVRSTTDAAGALAITLPRYYALEARAIEGLVKACEPRRRGPTRSQGKELESLRRDKARLERECARLQTLARLSQRTLGLAMPTPASKARPSASDPSGKPQGKKEPRRKKRPVSRALVAAKALSRAAAPPREEPAKPAGMASTARGPS